MCSCLCSPRQSAWIFSLTEAGLLRCLHGCIPAAEARRMHLAQDDAYLNSSQAQKIQQCNHLPCCPQAQMPPDAPTPPQLTGALQNPAPQQAHTQPPPAAPHLRCSHTLKMHSHISTVPVRAHVIESQTHFGWKNPFRSSAQPFCDSTKAAAKPWHSAPHLCGF